MIKGMFLLIKVSFDNYRNKDPQGEILRDKMLDETVGEATGAPKRPRPSFWRVNANVGSSRERVG